MSSKRDYYEVLGVQKDATADEIKAQYRKLALKFHPDRNKTAEAAEHFKEISEAYAVVSDGKKRKIYDRHGHAGVDGRYTTEDIFQGASGNFNDVFADLFGRRGGGGGFESVFETFMGQGGGRGGPGRPRGRDMLCETTVTLEDVLHGKRVEFDHKGAVACEACGSTGCAPGSTKIRCKGCGGSGQVRAQRRMGFASFVTVGACRDCGGQGRVVEKPCRDCGGRGVRKGKRRIEFGLPPGIDDGEYTMPGRGEIAPGGINGDLIVRVAVEPHRHFRRDGRNIFCDKHVTMVEAALGAEVRVPTLEGEEDVRIAAGTQPNHLAKLGGMGVPKRGYGGRGDQYVRIVVDVPKKLSKRQKALLDEFAKAG